MTKAYFNDYLMRYLRKPASQDEVNFKVIDVDVRPAYFGHEVFCATNTNDKIHRNASSMLDMFEKNVLPVVNKYM